MSSVRRDFIASPARLSGDTWQAITKLICQGDLSAQLEFEKVKGIGACLLDDEAVSLNPLVMKNKGPRLKIYCLYGADAISAENQNEEALSWKPTADKWIVLLPCLPENFEMMQKAMKGKSAKFEIYDIADGLPDEEEIIVNSTSATVDWKAFKNL